MEIYQWLLRKNGLKVSDTGYFVYCTGRANQDTFDKKIEFDVVVIPYTGSDAWVSGVIGDIKKCLDSTALPKSGDGCEYCMWFNTRTEWEGLSGATAPAAKSAPIKLAEAKPKRVGKKPAKQIGSPLF